MGPHRRWMLGSGLAGIAFFLVANFTSVFAGAAVLAGFIQLAINIFVFITWLRGYRLSHGRARLVALVGVLTPPTLALITLYRIIFPFLLSLG